MSNCDCSVEAESKAQRGVLWILLLINGFMFLAELIAGIVADSSGLIGDSIDMLADALVYGVALYVVGRSKSAKANAASMSGVFQAMLALFLAFDIVRRLRGGSDPEARLMVIVGLVALAANVYCLRLIARHRRGEIHMRASWIFTRNDVLVNLGVVTGGILVSLTGSRYPDLIIGGAIAWLVFNGGLTILRESAAARRQTIGPGG
jgi:cation diffusion facilitator family transporter